MNGITVSVLHLLAGVCLYAGLHHLLIWVRRPREGVQLTFALLCLFVAVYDISAGWMYQADKVADYVTALKWHIAASCIGYAAFVWFVDFYTRVRPRYIVVALSTMSVLFGIVNLASPFGLYYSEVHGLSTVVFPWGELVTELEGTRNPWVTAYNWIGIGIAIFSVYACFRQYKRGERRQALILSAGLTIYLGTIFYDAIQPKIVMALPLDELAFLALVVVMSLGLSDDLVRAASVKQALYESEESLRITLCSISGVENRTARLSDTNQQLQQEIKERKRVEEELELFRKFVETSGEGMGWADLEGRIRYANSTLCHMLGASSPEALLRTPVQNRYSEENRARLQEEVFPTVLREGLWTGELELQSLSGQVIPTMHSMFVLRDAKENPRWYANVISDLTERKHAENEIRRHRDHLEELVSERTQELQKANAELQQEISDRNLAERALRESEARYRLISENATDVIWTRNMDLHPTYISPSVESLRGYTVNEALLQTLDESTTPESVRHMRKVLAEEIAIEHRADADPARTRTIDVEMLCKDGSAVWVEVSMRFLRDRDQRPVGVLGISRNISEHKKMEKEQARLEEQLRQSQKMEAVGRLAGGVAHDFNNILTAISGYAEIVLSALGPENPLRSDVEEISSAANRATALTKQLLAFSRKQIIDPKVLDLKEVISHSEMMLRRIIGEDIEMTLSFDEELWWVRSDPGQVDQVLVNLAVNSRDAMPGSGKITVEIRNMEIDDEYCRIHKDVSPGDYVMLTVSDNGRGMDEEIRQRIFEPFFTTKQQGEGTGLGLSTVYGIAKQNNGFVDVYSEPGVGTTFKIFFPRVNEKIEKPLRLERDTAPGGKETVLLVEDDQTVRHLVRKILGEQGYTVIEAEEGCTACQVSENHEGEIQLLLTDVVMPQMSGSDLFQNLQEKRSGIKVLFMSGFMENAAAHFGVLDMGTNFIQKPFTVDSLLRKVREILDNDASLGSR